MTVKMTKWLEFRLLRRTDSGKTNVYQIWSKKPSFLVGEIRWYNGFRRYSFFPDGNAVFEETCMQDITDFLKQVSENHKTKKNEQRVEDKGTTTEGA